MHGKSGRRFLSGKKTTNVKDLVDIMVVNSVVTGVVLGIGGVVVPMLNTLKMLYLLCMLYMLTVAPVGTGRAVGHRCVPVDILPVGTGYSRPGFNDTGRYRLEFRHYRSLPKPLVTGYFMVFTTIFNKILPNRLTPMRGIVQILSAISKPFYAVLSVF